MEKRIISMRPSSATLYILFMGLAYSFWGLIIKTLLPQTNDGLSTRLHLLLIGVFFVFAIGCFKIKSTLSSFIVLLYGILIFFDHLLLAKANLNFLDVYTKGLLICLCMTQLVQRNDVTRILNLFGSVLLVKYLIGPTAAEIQTTLLSLQLISVGILVSLAKPREFLDLT